MIRTALLQLALGATLGGLLLIEKGLHLFPWLWMLRPGHIQIMLIGWVVQLACGVAVWILPRLDSSGGRGNMWLVWLCYSALNGGVALAAVHAPFARFVEPARLAWMLPIAALFYLVAVCAIAVHIWRRVLPFRALLSPSEITQGSR